MSTVTEIESAIRGLPSAELAELRAWFAEYEADVWDRQIAADAQNGPLDNLYQRLEWENGGEPNIPLHAVFNEEKLP